MPRTPRGDAPDVWHHVMNRGLARRTVFETDRDIRYFLSRLARSVRAGLIEVHAYCVLTTHFHLLVRSPRGELAEAMRRIQTTRSKMWAAGCTKWWTDIAPTTACPAIPTPCGSSADS